MNPSQEFLLNLNEKSEIAISRMECSVSVDTKSFKEKVTAERMKVSYNKFPLKEITLETSFSC